MGGRIFAVEQGFAAEDREIFRKETARIGSADSRQFGCACRRAVGYPQARMGGRVFAGEQHLAAQDREVRGIDSARPSTTDAGVARSTELRRARRGTVGDPQAEMVGGVEAKEQDLAAEDRELGRIETSCPRIGA